MSDPQSPTNGNLSKPFVPVDLPITSASLYLVVARYNREAWNFLGTIQTGTAGKTLQEMANALAEVAFPEEANAQPLPYVPGVRWIKSFHTDLHRGLKDAFIKYAIDKGLSATTIIQVPKSDSKPIVDAQLAQRPANDVGVGWVALVEGDGLNAFYTHLGGKDGPLCSMYSIEVIPLHNDLTTNDIYQFMTPVNWRK